MSLLFAALPNWDSAIAKHEVVQKSKNINTDGDGDGERHLQPLNTQGA